MSGTDERVNEIARWAALQRGEALIDWVRSLRALPQEALRSEGEETPTPVRV